MSNPTSREEFKNYCLRKLGAPVINIDVAEEQIEDRIDEALKFYYDYHYDGSNKVYYKHQLTQQNIDDGYITMPENIIGVISIFDIGTSIASSSGMFSIQYQIALNDLYSFSGVDLVPYWMTIENLQFMETILVGKQPIRYNKNVNRLFIDMNKNKLAPGQFVIAEAYEISDPETYVDVWKDRWLAKYCAALIKRQWGNNISKFSGINLPGNVTFNGLEILNSAEEEIEKLEEDMINNSLLVAFEIG